MRPPRVAEWLLRLATPRADREFLLDELASFDAQRQLLAVQCCRFSGDVFVGEQLLVTDGSCVQDVQCDLLPLAERGLAATFGFFVLSDPLLKFFGQSRRLPAHRLQAFALLGDIELIG